MANSVGPFDDKDKMAWLTRGIMVIGLMAVSYGGFTVKEELERTRNDVVTYQASVIDKLDKINQTLIAAATQTTNNTHRIETIEDRVIWLERQYRENLMDEDGR